MIVTTIAAAAATIVPGPAHTSTVGHMVNAPILALNATPPPPAIKLPRPLPTCSAVAPRGATGCLPDVLGLRH
jgi:hypothetical protein